MTTQLPAGKPEANNHFRYWFSDYIPVLKKIIDVVDEHGTSDNELKFFVRKQREVPYPKAERKPEYTTFFESEDFPQKVAAMLAKIDGGAA